MRHFANDFYSELSLEQHSISADVPYVLHQSAWPQDYKLEFISGLLEFEGVPYTFVSEEEATPLPSYMSPEKPACENSGPVLLTRKIQGINAHIATLQRELPAISPPQLRYVAHPPGFF